MTVRELIQLLEERPDNEEVYISGPEGEWLLIIDVKKSLWTDDVATFITTEEA